MALHSRRYNVKEETWQTQEGNRHAHLARMIHPGVANRFMAQAPDLKAGSTIAILPYPFDEEGHKLPGEQVMPDRWDADPENPRSYNRWLFKAGDRGVTRFGRGWLSVVFDNPEDSGWNFDDDHPIQLIYRNASFVVNDKTKTVAETAYGSSVSDDWRLLLKGDEGKNYPVIKAPDVLYAVFCIVYRSGKDEYASLGAPFGAATTDPIPVFIISRGTAASLMDEIDKPLSNAKASDGLLHPNVTGCKFIHFYNKQDGSCPALRAAGVAQQVNDGFGTRRVQSAQAGEQANTGFGYAVGVTNTHDGSANGRTVTRDMCAKLAHKRLLPWEQVIRGVGPQECAELVQQHCKLPLSVLAYAWASKPEFFTETTKSLMKAKVTTFMGAPGQSGHGTRVSDVEGFDVNPANAPADGADGWGSVDHGSEEATAAPPSTVTPPPAQPAAGGLSAAERFRQAMHSKPGAKPGAAPEPTVSNPPVFRKPNN